MSGDQPSPDGDPEETAPYYQPPSEPYSQPPPPPPYYAGINHQNATTSMWLGIVGLAGAVLTPICCVTLPLLVCSPIAWALGASARSAIDRTPPGTYANRGQAQAGFVTGIIGSVLGLLAILGLIAFGALFFYGFSTSP